MTAVLLVALITLGTGDGLSAASAQPSGPQAGPVALDGYGWGGGHPS
ncbi:hypothetical protein [Streptomyces tateyamensis]|nr:hypothetical protein [Streptomyces tateyamensis]